MLADLEASGAFKDSFSVGILQSLEARAISLLSRASLFLLSRPQRRFRRIVDHIIPRAYPLDSSQLDQFNNFFLHFQGQSELSVSLRGNRVPRSAHLSSKDTNLCCVPKQHVTLDKMFILYQHNNKQPPSGTLKNKMIFSNSIDAVFTQLLLPVHQMIIFAKIS